MKEKSEIIFLNAINLSIFFINSLMVNLYIYGIIETNYDYV